MQGEALVAYWNDNPEADRNGDGVLQYVMIMGDPGHFMGSTQVEVPEKYFTIK